MIITLQTHLLQHAVVMIPEPSLDARSGRCIVLVGERETVEMRIGWKRQTDLRMTFTTHPHRENKHFTACNHTLQSLEQNGRKQQIRG